MTRLQKTFMCLKIIIIFNLVKLYCSIIIQNNKKIAVFFFSTREMYHGMKKH